MRPFPVIATTDLVSREGFTLRCVTLACAHRAHFATRTFRMIPRPMSRSSWMPCSCADYTFARRDTAAAAR